MLTSGNLKDTGDNSDLPVHRGSRVQLAAVYEALSFVLVSDSCVLVMKLQIFVGWLLGIPAA